MQPGTLRTACGKNRTVGNMSRRSRVVEQVDYRENYNNEEYRMKRLALMLACTVLWVGLGRAADDKPTPVKLSDEEIAKLLLGQWEDSVKINGLTYHTSETFHKDGTFERVDTNGGQKTAYKGKWELKDGVLAIEPTDGPFKGIKVKGTITAIDEKTQKLTMEAGAEVTKTRPKE